MALRPVRAAGPARPRREMGGVPAVGVYASGPTFPVRAASMGFTPEPTRREPATLKRRR